MQKGKNQIKSQIQYKAALKIQNRWRIYQLRKKYKKILYQTKKKNFTALQLISSERTYCEHLKFIIKEVLQVSKKSIQDPQLHQILFCNITQIFLLHHIFLYQFQQVMSSYCTHKSLLSFPLKSLFTHQKFQPLYTQYCYNYSKADKIIKLLTENNVGFKEVLKKAGMVNSALSLQSYMIKPVQRLCKYQLMLKEYFKNMTNQHPDYQGIKEVINIIRNLADLTNAQVQQYLFVQRYRQIKYDFPNVFDKYPENPKNPRKLVYQFTSTNASLINLIKQEELPLQSIIVFNDMILIMPSKNSEKPIPVKILHLRIVQNMKYFKNLLQILGSTKYYTFEFKSDKQRDKLISIIQEKTNYLIDRRSYATAQVLGTQRRQSFFKFFTVYIVDINHNKKITKIYPRFKNLMKVQDILLKTNLFTEMHVPPLQKQSPHQTLKSKTIQRRKLHIRQFLERIINNQRCMKNNEIRQTLQYYQGRQQKKKNYEQDQILILLPNWQHIKILLNAKFSKIKQLKLKIQEQLQFVQPSQFQIFQIRNRSYSSKRLMYDDQHVNDIFLNQQSLNLNPFADKLQYMFSRHYYLSAQEELSLYKLDFIRLELELSVIKTQILQYALEEELMTTFMCLFAMYINLPMDDERIITFVKDIGKKAYKVTLPQFKLYYKEVQKIVSSQEDQSVTVPFLVIKILSNNRLYQCQQFQVQTHKKCFESIKKQIPSIEQKVILGIKLSHLMILTIKQKHLIKSIQYKDIESMQMYPNGIVFKINSLQSAFRIKTTQGYEINKLISIYKPKKVFLQSLSTR